MCVEIEDWGFSVHFVLRFQENSHFTITLTLYIYVLTKILQDSLFQKSHDEFGQLQTGTWKSKKLKFDGLLVFKNKFVQKLHFFSWNIIYKGFNFQLFVWKSTKLLVIISFFSTELLCIFLGQTLHTFYKSCPTKCKFSDFLLFGLKFTKFFVIFQAKSQFFLKVWISFQCLER